MLSRIAQNDLVTTVAADCRRGLNADALREAVIPRLRKAVPVDALWWAVADPLTLLFTRAHTEELPRASGRYFIENEFLHDDVNKWTQLAARPAGAGTLMEATAGHPSQSDRYRDIFEPLGLQDELRVVFRLRGATWGYLCMHRAAAESGFSPEETGFAKRLAPHLAEGIRLGMLLGSLELAGPPEGPGLLVLASDGSAVGTNPAADRWMDELGGSADTDNLPAEIISVETQLRHLDPTAASLPQLRVRTASGRWLVIHASWFNSPDADQVAVIIEPASTPDVAPVIMAAFGLTPRERSITMLVCTGLPTRAISNRLKLSIDTVQDHLKSVFNRTGTHSRGELVAILQQNAISSSAD